MPSPPAFRPQAHEALLGTSTQAIRPPGMESHIPEGRLGDFTIDQERFLLDPTIADTDKVPTCFEAMMQGGDFSEYVDKHHSVSCTTRGPEDDDPDGKGPGKRLLEGVQAYLGYKQYLHDSLTANGREVWNSLPATARREMTQSPVCSWVENTAIVADSLYEDKKLQDYLVEHLGNEEVAEQLQERGPERLKWLREKQRECEEEERAEEVRKLEALKRHILAAKAAKSTGRPKGPDPDAYADGFLVGPKPKLGGKKTPPVVKFVIGTAAAASIPPPIQTLSRPRQNTKTGTKPPEAAKAPVALPESQEKAANTNNRRRILTKEDGKLVIVLPTTGRAAEGAKEKAAEAGQDTANKLSKVAAVMGVGALIALGLNTNDGGKILEGGIPGLVAPSPEAAKKALDKPSVMAAKQGTAAGSPLSKELLKDMVGYAKNYVQTTAGEYKTKELNRADNDATKKMVKIVDAVSLYSIQLLVARGSATPEEVDAAAEQALKAMVTARFPATGAGAFPELPDAANAYQEELATIIKTGLLGTGLVGDGRGNQYNQDDLNRLIYLTSLPFNGLLPSQKQVGEKVRNEAKSGIAGGLLGVIAEANDNLKDSGGQSLGPKRPIRVDLNKEKSNNKSRKKERQGGTYIEGAKDLGMHTGWIKGRKVKSRFYAINGFKSSSEESTPGSRFYIRGAGGNVIVGKRAAPFVVRMFRAGKKEGITLSARSSFRTKAHQSTLCPCGGAWVARPGYSNHQNPRNSAIDFKLSRGVYGFLTRNAHKYKYVNYKPEPWHWAYGSGN